VTTGLTKHSKLRWLQFSQTVQSTDPGASQFSWPIQTYTQKIFGTYNIFDFSYKQHPHYLQKMFIFHKSQFTYKYNYRYIYNFCKFSFFSQTSVMDENVWHSKQRLHFHRQSCLKQDSFPSAYR